MTTVAAQPKTTTAKKAKSAASASTTLASWAPNDGADEPLVLAAPPAGRSGALRVRKSVHDALAHLSEEGGGAESDEAHVARVSAGFGQGVDGRRFVSLRLVLDDDFALDDLEARLARLQEAARARAAAVLGADFLVVGVDFGGKKLR